MERPALPQGASASDLEEQRSAALGSGTSAAKPRRQFHVGAQSKAHPRVPSYGKKLNQLGKLTALTNFDGRGSAEPVAGSPKQKSAIVRTSSARSLSDLRQLKRNTSTQDVRKTRRPSANQIHANTRSKVQQAARSRPPNTVGQDEWQDDTAEKRGDRLISNVSAPPDRQKPTFIIDEGDKSDDDAQSPSSKADKGLLVDDQAANLEHESTPAVPHDAISALRVSRDLTAPESNDLDISSASQPLISRFLETPTRRAVRSGGGRSHEDPGLAATDQFTSTFYASPHSSSAHLGSGTSRTQQKLLLQRASSIYDLNEPDAFNGHKQVPQGTLQRANKEFERIDREFRNVCRHRQPLQELSTRLHRRGSLGRPEAFISIGKRSVSTGHLNVRTPAAQMPVKDDDTDSGSQKGLQLSTASSRAQPAEQTVAAIEAMLKSLWQD
ncbi:hypothetical protein PYCC9005_003555 [Savitreella phatthalungensis]